jgi:hypothetical protein
MSRFHDPLPCPTCGALAFAVESEHPPRETTWDNPASLPSWRTFEPGPAATVTFDCGHSITGEAGLAWLTEYAAVPPTVVLGGVDLSPYTRSVGRLHAESLPDEPPVDLMDGYLAGLRSGHMTVSFDDAAPNVADYWPGLEDTARVALTMPVPANRWHRLLARLRGIRGFGWVRPRMVHQTTIGKVIDVRTTPGGAAFTFQSDEDGRRG